MTKTELLVEYSNCISDPTHMIENYMETFDKTQEGYVPFKLFEKQKEIIGSYQDHRFTIILKPRQAGVSTTTAAYCAYLLATADAKNPEKILILANKLDLATEIYKKIKAFLIGLPDWMDIQFITETKTHLVLSNNSECKALATSSDALRGYTPTFLIMDEAAYIEGGSVIWGACQAALGTGGKAALISTPNGLDELYYKTYDLAKRKKNNFNIVEMRWYQDPRFNKGLTWHKEDEIINGLVDNFQELVSTGWKPASPWYEEMCRNLNGNERQIATELDCSFVGSGGNVIDDEHIQYHLIHNVLEPLRTEYFDHSMWIWEDPIPTHRYLAGVDVARGDGEDASTIVIMDFDTGKQVAEYQGKLPPDTLAELVFEYGNRYQALTIVDITGGMGVATILKLIEMDYKYIHYDDPRSRILANRQDLSGHKKQDKLPGFNVGAYRLNMIAEMERSIRQGEIIIRSNRMISEMKTFVYKNGRPDHMKGYHDDLLMSLAMILWVQLTSFKSLESHNNKTKAMLDAMLGTSTAPNTPSRNVTYGNQNFGGNQNNGGYDWLFM